MLRDLDLTLNAVNGWLEVGRDVVLRGDDGSGRSTVLRTLACRITDHGHRVVVLSAAGPRDHAALLAHPSFPPSLAEASSIDLVTWLADELTGPHATLLVDDVDRLDAGSAEVVHQVLARTGASFVLSSGTRRMAAEDAPFVAGLLADRAPAEVRVRPMGFTSLGAMLAEVLEAPADVPLLASVAARSGGNPRAAIALTDAARYAGAIALRDGRWHSVASVERVPLDTLVNAFVPRLSRVEVDALEVMAWIGPVPIDTAARILDHQVIRDLSERGRLVGSHDAHGVPVLVVAPPALAAALRAGLSPQRRAEIAERAAQVDARFRRVEPERRDVLDTLLTPHPDEDGHGAHWIAALASQIEAHELARESELRAQWLAAPGVGTANEYLSMLGRRPAHEEMAAVYRQTPITGTEDPLDLALYRTKQQIWSQWKGQVSTEPGDDELEPVLELRRRRDEVLARVRAGEPLEPVLDELGPLSSDPWSGLIVAALTGVLIEAGRPDLALPLAERGDLAGQHGMVRHLVAGMRASALLMLGELDEVERQTRGLLSAAFAELDAPGIRVHGCVLAEVLYLSGRAEQAWTAISMVLRFGVAGPGEDPFYRRALALATSVRSRLGDPLGAQDLLTELRSLPERYRPPVASLLPLAEVAVAGLRGPEAVRQADEDLWQEGLRLAEEGMLGTALECWLLRPRPYTAEQMAVIDDCAARVSMPMLDRWYRMHRALAGDDPAEIRAAWEAMPPESMLGRVAATVLGVGAAESRD